MIIQAESFNQQLGSVIQAQLKTVGVDLKVTSLDRGTFFNKAFANPDSVMFFYLWPVPIDVVTLFVDPDTFTVRIDGEVWEEQPATELPMAQRYFLF